MPATAALPRIVACTAPPAGMSLLKKPSLSRGGSSPPRDTPWTMLWVSKDASIPRSCTSRWFLSLSLSLSLFLYVSLSLHLSRSRYLAVSLSLSSLARSLSVAFFFVISLSGCLSLPLAFYSSLSLSRCLSLSRFLSLHLSLAVSLALPVSLSIVFSLSRARTQCAERELFIDNLLVRIHYIIGMIK